MSEHKNVNINIEHLTRVEGHGNIVVNVTNGSIEKCQWQVVEAPRFFEAMVRGRHYSEVARITSRICGICSIGHTLASVKATEAALGMQISDASFKLRQLLKHAENFDSNVLHVYFLAAPDFFSQPSVFPMLENNSEVVARGLRLKRLAHEWGALIGGRTTHPTKVIPGGFSQFPSRAELIELKEKLEKAQPDMQESVAMMHQVADKIPEFERPTEYISLCHGENYAIYDGCVQSILADGTRQQYPVSDYRSITNEYVSKWSTAKYCKNKLGSYMVGALARVNNNYQLLCPNAKQVADSFDLDVLTTNPYKNTLAQLVELVNDLCSSIVLLEELIAMDIQGEGIAEPTRYGIGSAAVEVPRGILFHEYEYDNDGICSGGNFIIPTNQNHANIQLDFEKLLPELIDQGKGQDEIELAFEMLVRAYDPCISCSTHYLDMRFVS